MRKKKGFVLHRVCEQNIIVAEGKENIDFNSLIAMNETAAFIWMKMGDDEFTIDDMVRNVCKEYDTTEEIATRDCKELAYSWITSGIVEE